MTTNILTYNRSNDDEIIVIQSHLFYFWLFTLALMILLLSYSFVFAINPEGCNYFVCNVKQCYLAASAPFLPIICMIGLPISILGVIRVCRQVPLILKYSQLWHLRTESKPLKKLNKLFKVTYVLSIALGVSLLLVDIIAIHSSDIFDSTAGGDALVLIYGLPSVLAWLDIYILPIPVFILWAIYFIKRYSLLTD